MISSEEDIKVKNHTYCLKTVARNIGTWFDIQLSCQTLEFSVLSILTAGFLHMDFVDILEG